MTVFDRLEIESTLDGWRINYMAMTVYIIIVYVVVGEFGCYGYEILD